jgi:serine phosphatase RsbU (regulator of sigma subunit)
LRPKPAQVLVLGPGDTVALISDGVFEYENPAGEMFGNERVAVLLAAAAGETAEAQVQQLVAAVERFAVDAPQNDDMTIVVLRRL